MADAPTATIVVPTFARPAMLQRCLDGITHLEAAARSFEVVIVDDGGPEPLDALVTAYADRLNLRLIRQSRAGPAAARNAGVAAARGRFVVFIDDDCAPAPDWLAEFVRELTRDDRRLLGGRVENALIDNLYSTASEQISKFVYEYNRTGVAQEPFFTANNIALSADRFRAIGGFTTSIPSATAEDKEFCDRARAWTFAGACPFRRRLSRSQSHVHAVSPAAFQLRPRHPGVPVDSAPPNRQRIPAGTREVLRGSPTVADDPLVIRRSMAADGVARRGTACDVGRRPA